MFPPFRKKTKSRQSLRSSPSYFSVPHRWLQTDPATSALTDGSAHSTRTDIGAPHWHSWEEGRKEPFELQEVVSSVTNLMIKRMVTLLTRAVDSSSSEIDGFMGRCLLLIPVLSRGVFVLGFRILTRHRSVPWKSSWHTVRTVVPSPETSVKYTKLSHSTLLKRGFGLENRLSQNRLDWPSSLKPETTFPARARDIKKSTKLHNSSWKGALLSYQGASSFFRWRIAAPYRRKTKLHLTVVPFLSHKITWRVGRGISLFLYTVDLTGVCDMKKINTADSVKPIRAASDDLVGKFYLGPGCVGRQVAPCRSLFIYIWAVQD